MKNEIFYIVVKDGVGWNDDGLTLPTFNANGDTVRGWVGPAYKGYQRQYYDGWIFCEENEIGYYEHNGKKTRMVWIIGEGNKNDLFLVKQQLAAIFRDQESINLTKMGIKREDVLTVTVHDGSAYLWYFDK